MGGASGTMGASASDSEYVTALAPDPEQATASSSVLVTALEEQIDRSKSHWSELAEPDANLTEEDAAAKMDNEQLFKTLQRHPTWGEFFWGVDEFEELVVGEKFAEGAQAELFHAHVKWRNPKANEWVLKEGVEWVVKVVKKGTLLRQLQPQWPHGLFQIKAEMLERIRLGIPQPSRFFCDVVLATLLEDGRFAFLTAREDEDLRSHIDRKLLESGHGCGPFPKEDAEGIMYRVALGMDWLHKHNIVHRDLKASNVLVTTSPRGEYLYCFVADYECSIGVVGTGFWRAPEILQACKERNVNKRPELFTRAADAYSYGMTCYEILTGKVPFQDENVTMDLVILGQRPEVPEFIDDWARGLLCRCWQVDPLARPSFEEILSVLEASSNSEYIIYISAERLNLADEVQIPVTEVGF